MLRKPLAPLVTMEQDSLRGSLIPDPITMPFAEAFLLPWQHTTGDLGILWRVRSSAVLIGETYTPAPEY